MALRKLRSSDVLALAAWLPDVAKAIGCERWSGEEALRSAVGQGETLLYYDDAGVALVSYNIGTPRRGAARIDLLAVSPQQRRLGIGSRAAVAAEQRIAKSTRRIYVAVPARDGLALYFWLRLGYRPLMQQDWPEAPTDPPSAWMLRELR